MIQIEIYIIRDEQIELAVVVIVKKGGPGGPTRIIHAGFFGHVSKGPVAVVAQQMVWPETGDVHVIKPIIVVIADGHTHAESNVTNAGLVSDVGKRSIVVIVIESAPGLLPCFCQIYGKRVNKINIEVSIIVVVKQRYTAAHRL